MHQPAEVRVAMGIRQLPSGSFQVRFQLDHIAYAATYPTREMAEQAEPLLRARARMRADGEDDEPIEATPTPRASARAPLAHQRAVLVVCRSRDHRRHPR